MKKIIIIEDDTILNKTLAYNLVSDGYEVDSAYTCSMARELLKGNYHLALLDINLPDGSGLDLCAEIKERSPETYIIFLTANDRESDMLKGYEVGGADYFTKPFSVAVLCFLIQAMVKTSRLETGVIALEKKQAQFTETLTAALNGILAPMEKKQMALSVDCSDRNGKCILRSTSRIQAKAFLKKEQAAIFKRFYREDAVHDIDGIGIGLYLAREIVTMQGGYIKMVSAVGAGSTFSVFLPKK